MSAAFVCTVESTNFMEATSDYFCCPTSAINVLNMAIAGQTLHQTEKWPLILCENVCVFQQNLEILLVLFPHKGTIVMQGFPPLMLLQGDDKQLAENE